MARNVIPFQELRMTDVEQVGGKNASPRRNDQPVAASVRVPGGFATTADAYREFLSHQGSADRISAASTWTWMTWWPWPRLARRSASGSSTPFPAGTEAEIKAAYEQLTAEGDGSFAVRSSATAEDLPDASFAGQQESFLNIHGYENILHAIKSVRVAVQRPRHRLPRAQGLHHAEVALSAGVQRMVRSDIGASGVMFTLDTESGFDGVVFITASYGLGEMVVQGRRQPRRVLRAQGHPGPGQARGHPPQPGLQAHQDGLCRQEGRRQVHPHRSTCPKPTAMFYSLTDADVLGSAATP